MTSIVSTAPSLFIARIMVLVEHTLTHPITWLMRILEIIFLMYDLLDMIYFLHGGVVDYATGNSRSGLAAHCNEEELETGT